MICLLKIWKRIAIVCLRITKTVKKMAMWYTEYRYTVIQKLIYGSCWIIWFCGFTYDYHDDIYLFVYFIDVYLINSFIYNVCVYSFKIKNITWFQYVRGLCFVSFWHYIDYAVCLPIFRWVVYVLDKKVFYESMGWVYKLEEYLDGNGWIPRHSWSTNTKKKNIRKWDMTKEQLRLKRIAAVKKWEDDHNFFGLGTLFNMRANSRDMFPREYKDSYNEDVRDHLQFLYQEKLFAQGLDIYEAKRQAEEAFKNDKTDYWEDEVDAVRIFPKHVYKPDTSLYEWEMKMRREEEQKKYDHTSEELLDNLISVLSSKQKEQFEKGEWVDVTNVDIQPKPEKKKKTRPLLRTKKKKKKKHNKKKKKKKGRKSSQWKRDKVSVHLRTHS